MSSAESQRAREDMEEEEDEKEGHRAVRGRRKEPTRDERRDIIPKQSAPQIDSFIASHSS